jgi:hypothetical protein
MSLITVNGLAAFEANIEAWIVKEAARIKPLADKFLGTVADDAEAAFASLAAIAGEAVLAQAPALISGQEKFGAAVTNVVQTVEAQGKTVAIQTAQLATQQAFEAIATAAKAL